MFSLRPLSRRAALARAGAGVLTAALAARHHGSTTVAAQESTPIAGPTQALPAEVTAIIEAPKYAFSRWGIHLADRATGEVLTDLNGGARFLAASTTKLYPAAAALDAYGPDHRFETPVYRTGPVGASWEFRDEGAAGWLTRWSPRGPGTTSRRRCDC